MPVKSLLLKPSCYLNYSPRNALRQAPVLDPALRSAAARDLTNRTVRG